MAVDGGLQRLAADEDAGVLQALRVGAPRLPLGHGLGRALGRALAGIAEDEEHVLRHVCLLIVGRRRSPAVSGRRPADREIDTTARVGASALAARSPGAGDDRSPVAPIALARHAALGGGLRAGGARGACPAARWRPIAPRPACPGSTTSSPDTSRPTPAVRTIPGRVAAGGNAVLAEHHDRHRAAADARHEPRRPRRRAATSPSTAAARQVPKGRVTYGGTLTALGHADHVRRLAARRYRRSTSPSEFTTLRDALRAVGRPPGQRHGHGRDADDVTSHRAPTRRSTCSASRRRPAAGHHGTSWSSVPASSTTLINVTRTANVRSRRRSTRSTSTGVPPERVLWNFPATDERAAGQQRLEGRRSSRPRRGVDHQRATRGSVARPRRDDQRASASTHHPFGGCLPPAADAAGAVSAIISLESLCTDPLTSATRCVLTQQRPDRVRGPLGGHRLRAERHADRPGQRTRSSTSRSGDEVPSHRRHVGLDDGRDDDRHQRVRRQHRRQQGRDGRGHATCGPVGDRRQGRQLVLADRRARRRSAGDRGGPGALPARVGGHRRDRRGL